MQIGPFRVGWLRRAMELPAMSGREHIADVESSDIYPMRTPLEIRKSIQNVLASTTTTIGEHAQVSELMLPMTETVLLCGMAGVIKAGVVIVAPGGVVTGDLIAKTAVIFGRVGLGATARVIADNVIVCSGATLSKVILSYSQGNSMHHNVSMRECTLEKFNRTSGVSPFETGGA